MNLYVKKYYFEVLVKTSLTMVVYLYGKYSTQTMTFWSLSALIWFKNMKKMLLQMTSGFLQLESTIDCLT
jgi:hypothetical protein